MAVQRLNRMVRDWGERALSRIKDSWRSWRALIRTLGSTGKAHTIWAKDLIVFLAMEPLPFWIAIAVVLVAFICVWTWPTEAAVRYVGLALQLLGISTVALGIRRTRKEFGHPSIRASAHQLLRRVPPLPGRRVVLAATSVSASAATGKGFAFIWERAGANASVEARLDVAEKNIGRVREHLDHFLRYTQERHSENVQALEVERTIREQDVQSLRDKLVSTHTGGLHISALGALWLFTGVTFGTIPAEIATLINAFKTYLG